jgi:hypothetical protein
MTSKKVLWEGSTEKLKQFLELKGKEMKKCRGCEEIKERNYPFIDNTSTSSTTLEAKLYIDQEGCGINGVGHLEIFYCPVCGKKIQEKK